jgi:hypothetical protein
MEKEDQNKPRLLAEAKYAELNEYIKKLQSEK